MKSTDKTFVAKLPNGSYRVVAKNPDLPKSTLQQLREAQNTIENVKHWRLWAHETYNLPLKGTVTSNALNKILGIEPEPRTPEQIAYTAKIRAEFEAYALETQELAPEQLEYQKYKRENP